MSLLLKVAGLVFAAAACWLTILLFRLIAGRISKRRLILVSVAVLAWLNLLFLFVWRLFLGGSADLGMIRNGRYFVGQYGRYTEVSAAAYWFDLWYSRFTAGLVAGATLVVLFLMFWSKYKRRQRLSREQAGESGI